MALHRPTENKHKFRDWTESFLRYLTLARRSLHNVNWELLLWDYNPFVYLLPATHTLTQRQTNSSIHVIIIMNNLLLPFVSFSLHKLQLSNKLAGMWVVCACLFVHFRFFFSLLYFWWKRNEQQQLKKRVIFLATATHNKELYKTFESHAYHADT